MRRMPSCPLLCRLLFALVLTLGLGGCIAGGSPDRPIPTRLVAATQTPQRLVVVLPGRGDDLSGLQRSGVAGAIQSAWPDADVMLVELTLGYYRQGRAPERLHEEVIAPVRAQGRYREIWLVGASMGGMGTLLYDRLRPGELDGLVLMAPYLGDRPILREVADAGGLAQWQAGPERPIDAGNWQRELWRHLQSLQRDPDRARRIWLTYGDDDRLRAAMPLLTPALPPEQVLVRDGGHAWKVWSPALGEVLRRVDATRDGSAPEH